LAPENLKEQGWAGLTKEAPSYPSPLIRSGWDSLNSYTMNINDKRDWFI